MKYIKPTCQVFKSEWYLMSVSNGQDECPSYFHKCDGSHYCTHGHEGSTWCTHTFDTSTDEI